MGVRGMGVGVGYGHVGLWGVIKEKNQYRNPFCKDGFLDFFSSTDSILRCFLYCLTVYILFYFCWYLLIDQ
jgi:hypothetical protein